MQPFKNKAYSSISNGWHRSCISPCCEVLNSPSYKARPNGGAYVLYWFNRWPYRISKCWHNISSNDRTCKNKIRDVIFKQNRSKNR